MRPIRKIISVLIARKAIVMKYASILIYSVTVTNNQGEHGSIITFFGKEEI